MVGFFPRGRADGAGFYATHVDAAAFLRHNRYWNDFETTEAAMSHLITAVDPGSPAEREAFAPATGWRG